MSVDWDQVRVEMETRYAVQRQAFAAARDALDEQRMLLNASPLLREPPPAPVAIALRREVEQPRRRLPNWLKLAAILSALVTVLGNASCASTRPVVLLDVVERQFVMDLCAGGALTPDITRATYFNSEAAAWAAIDAADVDRTPLVIVLP